MGGGEAAGKFESGGGQLLVFRLRQKAHVVAAVAAFAVALVLVVAWDSVHAQEVQPPSSLRIMAPASPGGGWDQTARLAQAVVTERGYPFFLYEPAQLWQLLAGEPTLEGG